MVFFFFIFLSFIFIVVFPIRLSIDGYFDRKSKKIAFCVKFSFIEKIFGEKNRRIKNQVKNNKKHSLSIPIKPWELPLSIIKNITIKMTFPPRQAEIMTYLTMLKALRPFLPFEIVSFCGKKFYLEISAKISVNLFELFPSIRQILQKRRKNGNNIIA